MAWCLCVDAALFGEHERAHGRLTINAWPLAMNSMPVQRCPAHGTQPTSHTHRRFPARLGPEDDSKAAAGAVLHARDGHVALAILRVRMGKAARQAVQVQGEQLNAGWKAVDLHLRRTPPQHSHASPRRSRAPPQTRGPAATPGSGTRPRTGLHTSSKQEERSGSALAGRRRFATC